MEIQHTHKHFYAPDEFNENDINKSSKEHGFGMKQLIFWILMVLSFICVVSLGMIVINYCLQAKV
jgi:hypothetical protein